MTKPARDMLHGIQRTSLVLGVAAVSIAGLVWGLEGMKAAGAGAFLSILNFWGIRRLGAGAIRRVSEGGSSQQAAGLVFALVAKMTVLFALVWVCVRVLGLAVLPFSLGISVFVFAILIAGVGFGLRQAEEVL